MDDPPTDGHGTFFTKGSADPQGAFDPWREAGADPGAATEPQPRALVELLGTSLRVQGWLDLGHFARVSDYVNFLHGFCTIRDVNLLSRLGEPTRLNFPDLRVRLDEIAIIGQRDPGPVTASDERDIPKERRRLVVTTLAHIVYGYAFIHEQASTTAFIDATEPPFIPLVNVRIRWLADRRLAGRFPFALVHRSHIIGVATEVSGALGLQSDRGLTSGG